ncbi:MAG: LVIVD repeat-containing protein [Halolamina sp.]
MRRRDALSLLGGALLARPVAGHPTPPADDPDGTPPTRTDDGYSPLAQVEVEGATEAVVSDDGTTAFVAATTGYAVVDVADPDDPAVLADQGDLLADHEDGPLEEIYDVKLSGETLLVVGPANAGGSDLAGALVVDVADPANPAQRAFYETDYPIHNAFLDGDRAYLTANEEDRSVLSIVDVADEPTEIGAWGIREHDEQWGELPALSGTLHDVYVQDDVAYLAHWDAGTWLLDVSDPASPSVVSHLGRGPETVLEQYDADEDGYDTLPGNSHYAAVDEAADLLAVGREAWATDERPEGGPGGIDLYDLTDPEAPEHLSTIDPPWTPDATLRGSWTTAHNFEFRDGTLYSSWYRGGVKRHDVSDPANPAELTWWADRPHAEFWTARVAVPGSTFVASSRATGSSPAALYVFPDADGETTWGFDDEASTRTETSPETPTPAETPSAVGAPGFGPLAALGAVGTGALAWWRGRDRS